MVVAFEVIWQTPVASEKVLWRVVLLVFFVLLLRQMRPPKSWKEQV